MRLFPRGQIKRDLGRLIYAIQHLKNECIIVRDVIVIGAGPAGSTTAKVVASEGFDVQLIEKRKLGETKACGGLLSYKVMKELCPNTDIGKRVSRIVFCFPWGKKIEENMDAIVVSRGVFDRILAEEAKKRGAELTTETKVTNVKRENGLMRVYMKNLNDGSLSSTSCKIIMFADGPMTLAAKAFPGVGFEGNPNNLALGVRYELECINHVVDHCEVHFGSDLSSWGYGWVFPGKNLLNVGVGSLLSKLGKSRKRIKETLSNFTIKRNVSSEKITETRILEFGAALIPLTPARKMFSHSILVVGDAAGMVNPLLGAGIDYAVHAAELAGQTASEALERRDCSGKLLSKYQMLWERSPDYSLMQKGQLITKTMLPFSRVDKNLIAKVEYLLRCDRKALKETLRAMLYPICIGRKEELY